MNLINSYKNRGFIYLFLIATTMSFGQVGIGTLTPDGVLDLNLDQEKDGSSTNKYGLVLPRVMLSRTDEAAPVLNSDPAALPGELAIGTVVYNTVTTNFGEFSVYPGIYMWDGIDWINEFPKKNASIFKQEYPNPSAPWLRTITTGSYQEIPGLGVSDAKTFTPAYSGTYKIEVSVNWGSGTVEDPGSTINIAAQKGVFKFTFGSPAVDELIPVQTWSAKYGAGTVYFDIWEQFTIVLYKDLVAGTAYSFNLGFDQTVSDGFIGNGNSGQGMGWIGIDLPCTVEFVFLD
ncbi:hypothetical protein [Rasiella sp. SM2506]|uniref:hypothetical protein n=1 Tax=Rasiella sp. SM2506 TaxID=3423914 RepID=UPI003D7B68CD